MWTKQREERKEKGGREENGDLDTQCLSELDKSSRPRLQLLELVCSQRELSGRSRPLSHEWFRTGLLPYHDI